MVSWLRPWLVSIAIPSLNPDGIYYIANSSHPAVFVDIQCVYLMFLVGLKMEAGYSSSMTLSICLQPLHDGIFTSGLWVCGRAHVSGIRGNFFWPAQLFSSGLWMPARLAAKHQGACAKKMQNIHFFHVIADLWNHFHHLSRKNYGQMGGASRKHLSLYISANRNSNNRWSIGFSFTLLAQCSSAVKQWT